MDIAFSLVTAFVCSFFSIKFAKPIAEKINLVDKPSGRKQHSGNVPLVGGIAIFIGFMISSLLWFPQSTQLNLFIIASAMMVFIGVLDDRHDLSVRVRIVFQILIASLMIFGTKVYIHDLGNIFGLGNLDMSWVGIIFTYFAILGMINAFNMVDGIDGLVGSMAINTLTAMTILLVLSGNKDQGIFTLMIVMAIVPYLIFNLGLFGGRFKKIFMGDAGSMFIGFAVVWLLALNTQGEGATFRPVTALWIVAVPLMDMAAIIIRRVKKGNSPFKPDRDHLHHIFLRAGFTSFQALLIITLISVVCSAIGILGELFNVPEPVLFFSFIALFGLYNYALLHVWKLTKYVRKHITN